jgi:hypothetical protein
MMPKWFECEHGNTLFGFENHGCHCKPTQKPAEANQWVPILKLLRKPEDKGVGDTVQRIAAKFGGERFKAFAAKIGLPCGCTDRQAWFNERFPY